MGFYKNLLTETLEELVRNNKAPDDVLWVMDGTQYCTWEIFKELAKDFNYDAGFGGAEVNEDMVIVGEDWWLERGEYDGSEWWEFKTQPKLTNQILRSDFDLRCNFDRQWDDDDD